MSPLWVSESGQVGVSLACVSFWSISSQPAIVASIVVHFYRLIVYQMLQLVLVAWPCAFYRFENTFCIGRQTIRHVFCILKHCCCCCCCRLGLDTRGQLGHDGDEVTRQLGQRPGLDIGMISGAASMGSMEGEKGGDNMEC